MKYYLLAVSAGLFGSQCMAQGVECNVLLAGTELRVNHSNSWTMSKDNLAINSAIGLASAIGLGISLESSVCCAEDQFLFLTFFEADTVDLLTDTASASVTVVDIDPLDPAIGVCEVSGSATANIALLSGLTSQHISQCLGPLNCYILQNCKEGPDEAGIYLNSAQAFPVVALTYDVEPINAMQSSSLSSSIVVSYDLRTVFIDECSKNGPGKIIKKTRISYYRASLVGATDADSIQGLYINDESGVVSVFGVFADNGYVKSTVLDEDRLIGEQTFGLSVDIVGEDSVEMSIVADSFVGHSADVNKDGVVDCADRDYAIAVVTAEPSYGDAEYDPRVDFDLDLDVDSVDLWLFKGMYFDTNLVCERRADSNCSGAVDGADFTSWLSLYNAGSPFADANNDGAITPADFTAWVSEFNTCTNP